MIKRVVYLLLSFFIYLSMFITSYLILDDYKIIPFLIIFLYALMNFVFVKFDKSPKVIFLALGIFTIFFKRIYFEKEGHFWFRYNGNILVVYDQNYFTLKEKKTYHYNGDIKELMKIIRGRLKEGYDKFNPFLDI